MSLYVDLGFFFSFFVPSPPCPYMWNQNLEMIPIFIESNWTIQPVRHWALGLSGVEQMC